MVFTKISIGLDRTFRSSVYFISKPGRGVIFGILKRFEERILVMLVIERLFAGTYLFCRRGSAGEEEFRCSRGTCLADGQGSGARKPITAGAEIHIATDKDYA